MMMLLQVSRDGRGCRSVQVGGGRGGAPPAAQWAGPAHVLHDVLGRPARNSSELARRGLAVPAGVWSELAPHVPLRVRLQIPALRQQSLLVPRLPSPDLRVRLRGPTTTTAPSHLPLDEGDKVQQEQPVLKLQQLCPGPGLQLLRQVGASDR